MDSYDENLSGNKFLISLKQDFEVLFNEAISNQYLICVPKSEAIKELSQEEVLDHILIPSEKDENEANSIHFFTTKKGAEVILNDGKISLKDNTERYLNILFEETFYEGNFKKYKVICIEDYISNIFRERDSQSYSDHQILTYLRSACDFTHFIGEVSHPSILNEIDGLIKDFLAVPISPFCHLKLKNLRKSVHILINKSVKKCYELNKPLSECQTKILFICIESYIIHKIYNVLFQITSLDMAANDEKLNRILHSIRDLNFSNVDVKVSNINWILNAKYELASINNFKSPFGKLQSIKRAIQCFKTVNTLTSDEMLPILAYCIIKCNLTNWFANLHFLKSFTFNLKSNSEYNYILSSFEASIFFINSGEINKQGFQKFTKEIYTNCNVQFFELEEFNPKSQKCESETQFLLYESIRKNNLEKVKCIFQKKEIPSNFSNIARIESHFCHPLCICNNCKLVFQEYSVNCIPIVTPNMKDENMTTPLHISAWYGSIDIVEYLISIGVDYNAKNVAGMSPLHFAAYKGQQSILLLLLHSGCDINCIDSDGNTALHLACKAGHDSSVKALIFYAESVGNLKCLNMKNVFGDTPLHLASHWGYLSIVQFLVSQSKIACESLVLKNLNNLTPLDCAHNKLIHSVLKEIEEKDFQNPTSLILLNFEPPREIKGNHYIAKEELKENNSLNLNCESKKNILRKVLQAIKVGDINLAYFFLGIKHNQSSRMPTLDKCHPLCQCSNCSIIFPLIRDESIFSVINLVGEEGIGMLHMAILCNNLEMCLILLQNGANPQLLTKVDNQTSLHLSVIPENLEIMKYLISFNANINSTDVFGNTPLHICCSRGWKEGVKLLIDYGADICAINKDKFSPKEEAEKNGYIEIGELFRKV